MNGRDNYSSRSGRDDRRDRDRRRSRSPAARGGSRRDYELDTYSSSRNYREREREDRYRDGRGDDRGGRDHGAERGGERGGERAWDRDRGGGDFRRGGGDRRGERGGDRDLFDDRRGGGGGGGGRRGDRDRQERKRSASPPKVRLPTPDLTDIVPINERKRRRTQWDIKPPGYDNITAEQAKLSGMFPLPGAPRQQPIEPSRLQALMNQPAGAAKNSTMKLSNAKQSKRIFAYNVPASLDKEGSLQDFFNLEMNGLNVVSGPDPCISVQMSKDRTFAMLEFKTAEDATMALALDGVNVGSGAQNGNGAANGSGGGVSIQRPRDYIVPNPDDDEEEDQSMAGVVANRVKDGPNKITVANIPVYLTDDQVTELLVSFGELKAFILVKDNGTEQSKGIAFCEYVDSSNTALAVEGLNGMELGDQLLRVTRANVGASQAPAIEMSVNAMSMLASTADPNAGGRVLQLLNMVTAQELMDNEEYEEIVSDVREECEKFGNVLDMHIPRPGGGSRGQSGVGKIFVKYEDVNSAKDAMKALAGRKFDNRTVLVTFFGEDYFDVGAW